MPRRAHNPLDKHIQAVRVTLRRLDGQLRGLVPAFAKATKASVATVAAAKAKTVKLPGRKLRLSPERRRALKVHGQYLGYVRQLKPRQKAQVKAAKAKGGYRAAIAMAKKLATRTGR